MSAGLSAEWVSAAGQRIAKHFERELEALVAVSSPSGDPAAAEELCALVAALLPDEATIERPPCSTPGFAPDLLATVTGTGSGRVLLLGHLDTVIAHADHRPLERHEGKLVGSGSVDMKGGVALSLGRDAGAGRGPRELCRAQPADRGRRGMAHRWLRPWPALRRLRRLPLLRGRPARTRRGGGGGGEAQGGVDAQGRRPRRRRALRLLAGEGEKRAARPRRGGSPGRRAQRPERARAADRDADGSQCRRRLQRRPRRGRADL